MTLGGGGHPGAGGCHLAGELVGAKDKVVRALDAAFARPSRPSYPPHEKADPS
jgi:nanoRNase/pAp phosphatase (c-di-AMP/oligoRNAs hydrolase)